MNHANHFITFFNKGQEGKSNVFSHANIQITLVLNYLPVEPNPPAPRSVSDSSVTTSI